MTSIVQDPARILVTGRAQVQADSTQELAENRASEIARLVSQVDDLRADLRRARQET